MGNPWGAGAYMAMGAVLAAGARGVNGAGRVSGRLVSRPAPSGDRDVEVPHAPGIRAVTWLGVGVEDLERRERCALCQSEVQETPGAMVSSIYGHRGFCRAPARTNGGFCRVLVVRLTFRTPVTSGLGRTFEGVSARSTIHRSTPPSGGERSTASERYWTGANIRSSPEHRDASRCA